MKKNRLSTLLLIIGVILTSTLPSCSNDKESRDDILSNSTVSIIPGGNSWALDSNRDIDISRNDKDGSATWREDGTIRCWFKTDKIGSLYIALNADIKGEADATVIVKVGDIEKTVPAVTEATDSSIAIGKFLVTEAGYNSIDITVDQLKGAELSIKEIMVGGEATEGELFYSKDDYYWSRRGPSVHLGYTIPEEAGDVKWFYNEINVPKGNDVIGTYFMANGFGQGYFGIQVNEETERRVLFSVWSPFQTDNPEDIPDDQKIQLLKKGESVHSGEFGNEGSGGQSYRKYMWSADVDYRFLLKVEPSGKDMTDYTAYFFAPEIGEWELIASFRRPTLATYLTRPHSFLENFIPQQGTITRMAKYSNQWVCNKDGKWFEMTEAKFTADNTARKENRMDYAGGSADGTFFMKNCGFFNENTVIDSKQNRPARGVAPEIDFTKLP